MKRSSLLLLTAVQKWRHYLLGGPFIIRMDQISLKHLLEQGVNHVMQYKGLCKLMGMDYKIEYKKEIENKVADALSRLQGQNGEKELELIAVTELILQWVNELKDSYEQEPWIQKIKEKFAVEGDQCKFKKLQGIWRHKGRLCVGRTNGWKEKIIKEINDTSIGGHSGILASYKRIKLVFYWPHMKDDVYKYIKACDNCQQNNDEHVKLPNLLQPLPIPDEAWRSISMDFISRLPKFDGKEVIFAE